MHSKTLVIPVLIWAALSLASCSSSKPYTGKFKSKLIPKEAFVFFAIGDWGRNGDQNQTEIAQAMKECAEMLKPKFIISTGDNFYTYGVASIDDPQWMSSYENVYKGDALQIEWFPVLGNHDYLGNTEAQIAYTKKSRRWVMPSNYHTFTRKAKGQKIRFTFIDTNPLIQKYRRHADEYPDLLKLDTLKQWHWVDSVFKASDADKEDWEIVIGHHPVYSSNPKHGDTPELQASLEPRLEKHKVDAYICGHDHDLQHQKPDSSTVDYILSGAGSEVRPTSKYRHTKYADSVPGFAIISIQGNTMTLFFVNKKGKVVYSYTRTKP